MTFVTKHFDTWKAFKNGVREELPGPSANEVAKRLIREIYDECERLSAWVPTKVTAVTVVEAESRHVQGLRDGSKPIGIPHCRNVE
jgi:hypothetical protein